MHTDLVCAAGLDVAADCCKTEAGVCRQQLVSCDGCLAVSFHYGHLLSIEWGTSDQVLDSSLCGDGNAMDDGEIRLLHIGVGRELLCENIHCALSLGDDHHAGGVLIESMDYAGTGDATDACEGRAVVKKGVDEGAGEMSGCGMHDKPGGFVYDDDVVVLVQDCKRDVLWVWNGGYRRGNGQDDVIAGRDLLSGLGCAYAVDGHETGLYQTLQAGTGEIGMAS